MFIAVEGYQTSFLCFLRVVDGCLEAFLLVAYLVCFLKEASRLVAFRRDHQDRLVSFHLVAYHLEAFHLGAYLPLVSRLVLLNH